MNRRILYFLFLAAISCTLAECRLSNRKATPGKETFDTSPVVSPQESLKKMTLEDGFDIKLVAAEPLVSSPVALNFDDKGRMWVVEMQGYMPDAEGEGEDKPNGKIVILEDKNQDGVMDDRKVFLDSLVLPRSICLIENGILLVEPPRLWYIEINNDKPGKRILIDDAYTEGDNVEGQANSLYRARDNWIYNTRSEKRYRKKNNKWLTERTHLRGQWSVSQDNYGHLFYNNNSQNLLGDFFMPGLGAANTDQQDVAGFNEIIVPDNRVYPSRPTPGVNRGYTKGVLDSNLRLLNFTAASGPVIYRGDLFDTTYQLNAFVAEPAANLIKRNILEEKGNQVTGRQAYVGKEFLTSLDERFRPVTLYNGPDGALYVVDMYRGIIQHKSLMTAYLKNEVQKRSLDQPTNCGRIYKIVPKNKTARPVQLPDDPVKLVTLLQHPNGWVRDKAQQMLIDGKYTSALPSLKALLKDTGAPVTISHALWTMEGLEVLQPEDVLPLLKNADWKIREQALSILYAVVNATTYQQFVPVLKQMITEHDSLAAPYIAFQVHTIQPYNKVVANELLLALAGHYANDKYVADAIISNLENREAAFDKTWLAIHHDTGAVIHKQLQVVMKDVANYKNNRDNILIEKQYPRGIKLFKSICQTCHGTTGNGITSLAPPLNQSAWVTGDKDKLISIVLFGLVGPVKVHDKVYKAPEINGDMPALGSNKDIVDEDIAQVLSYIRNSWNNKADQISAKDISNVRRKFTGRQHAFTAGELELLK